MNHRAEVVERADAVGQRGAEVLPAAGLLAHDERGEDAGDGVVGRTERTPRGVVVDGAVAEAEVATGEDAGSSTTDDQQRSPPCLGCDR